MKFTFKTKSELKIFSNISKLREYGTSRNSLKKLLKNI